MNELIIIIFGFCSLMSMLVINIIRDGLRSKDLEKQMDDFLSTWQPSDYRFYGDVLTEMIKNTKKSLCEIATDMGISERVLLNIKSKKIKGYRHIRFFEAVKVIVDCNVSLDDALTLLTYSNFCLNPKSVRDQIIFTVIKSSHRNNIEKQERLDCIEALESNEPFNDNDYDYSQLFDYLYRQYKYS